MNRYQLLLVALIVPLLGWQFFHFNYHLPATAVPNPTHRGIYTPILMYHRITLKRPQQSYFVSPQIFEQQMQWLLDNGYKVISIDELYQALKNKSNLPDKPAVLTFDDGDEDQFTNALPILKKFGYPATFYIITGKVGLPGYMSWEQVKQLQKDGMTIGAHSVTHANLTKLSKNQLDFELIQSKKVMEEHLNIPINHFCYPGGAFNRLVIETTMAAGYLTATTTYHEVYREIKSPEDFYQLARIHIDDELPSFIDWIQGRKLTH